MMRAASPGLTLSSDFRLAPRRSRLTQTFGSGVTAKTATPGANAPLTYFMAVPIEAPCYAARIGMLNPFNVAMTISKASIYPSDSYSLCDTMLSVNGASNTLVVPTGGATGNPLYFDNAGADLDNINTAGTLRSITLAADATNASNVPKAATIQWSDFVPCVSIPRADGGTLHLLFIYVTISTAGSSVGLANFGVHAVDAVAARNRKHYTGIAWTNSTDFADNPTGTGYKVLAQNPVFALQYLTAAPGIQIVGNGDSLAAAPTTDSFSTPLWRAAADLSTPSLPVAFASLAWGGTAAAVYSRLLDLNAAAFKPSLVSYQPLSRNDTFTTPGLDLLLAKALALGERFSTSMGTRLIYQGAMPEPSADGNGTQTGAFTAMRALLAALAVQSDVPVFDGSAVLGNATSPWLYGNAAWSDDNTHPNSIGAELVVPLVKPILQRALQG
jgi:hypothetical protein